MELPLQNPTLVLALVLGIILLAPIVFRKLRIPSIIGLILAGMLVGPYGLDILAYDQAMTMLGKIGLLYIMFLSGIEIDLNDFRRNRSKCFVFGLYTFLVPMTLGILSGIYLLHFSFLTATMLASMYASHTLVAYPIVNRYGVVKNRSVNITVGGTMMTVTLALLILAGVSGYYKGTISGLFWLRMLLFSALFCFVVLYIFPRIAQFCFKRYNDSILQYILVLTLVALGAFLAELAGLEGILGAFLTGLALNKHIPNLSPLMNRINFVGNALFIPIFLIGVGMLVDVRVFTNGYEALFVALVMTVVATLSKWLAAFFTQKTFGMKPDERRMIFGLSNAQAAATLAAVMIGYNIILPDGSRLLNENVLNGTIIMILITCAISSFVTERAAQRIAISEEKDSYDIPVSERILIPISNPETCDALMEVAVLMTEIKSHSAIYALSVIRSQDEQAAAQKLLERAVRLGAASDNRVEMVTQVAANIANGITDVVESKDITDIVVGMHEKLTDADSFFGTVIEHMLTSISKSICIYRQVQPINTIKRIVVAVPAHAELESGFWAWFERVRLLAMQIGVKICFYANEDSTKILRMLCARPQRTIAAVFSELDDWEDFLIIAKEILPNDLLIIVSARKATASYNPLFVRIPYVLSKFFTQNSYMVLFPSQEGTQESTTNILFNTSVQTTELDANFYNRLKNKIQRILHR